MDSGASDSVAPPNMFPDIPLIQTNLSKGGLHYTAAGGHKIRNLGMVRPVVYTHETGQRHMMTFQVADVHKALGAVSKIVGAGHRVIFDCEEVGSYIEDKRTGHKTKLRQHNGVYFLDVWMKPGEHVPAQGFPRQAP